MKKNDIALPSIRAMIRSDGTGELTIDGKSQQITAVDEAGVREEIINRVAATARTLGRPVRLTAEDEQGQSPLIVHPDGDVDADGDFIPAAALPSATRPLVLPAETAPDSGEHAGSGDHADSGEVAVEPAAYRPVMVESAPGAAADDDRAESTEAAPPAVPGAGLFEKLVFDRDLDRDVDDDEPAEPSDRLAAAGLPVSASASGPASASGTTPGTAGPNLSDFMSSRPPMVEGPALQGWQGTVRRLTGGLVSPGPGTGERSHRSAVASVQRSLIGPRTIVVLNPKGGAHKTTATLLIAATFGIHRGGYTLAWDNNETMGTLGVRAQTAQHTNTAVDLLRDLENFAYSSSARVGDLDNYVRNQGDARFDALASDLDPAGAASIDDVAFGKLHAALSRFYRVLIIDTGNNMRASNWEAAVETADQLVVVSTIREDTAYGAASLLDGLRLKGHGDKVAQAVTILASPAKTADRALSRRLHDHFSQLTRAVVDVPYDPALVAGGPLNIEALAPRTREAWLFATAAIAEGL
ncbi:MinD-like ATPase involved in chromosome partitioning or flagellar assembly [Cryobacterium sp. MP_M5]|uniref:MinD/ParA family ATP-binding protein n=1 Tax=unclassified Cryobacterium TaxID=2649013 RepID=UPI0018C96CB0|nr:MULTISPECIES: chromosome partitioning protein [unclassified Cryobacterium]MBG6056935.1 MinD-like ATPase involved in chromosome partitioning or flagellar assembly [Cryobacterium sp. MP_M3]MEC5175134.1 MinD-like ATPase involved in chromosome partitioning or flagellar assembly [Cryobacterium sp. MP_M5]